MSDLGSRIDRISKASEDALIDFLKADLSLSFTILETAAISRNPEHTARSLQHVRRGIAIIAQLLGRVTDPDASAEIWARLNELEAALTAHNSAKP